MLDAKQLSYRDRMEFMQRISLLEIKYIHLYFMLFCGILFLSISLSFSLISYLRGAILFCIMGYIALILGVIILVYKVKYKRLILEDYFKIEVKNGRKSRK